MPIKYAPPHVDLNIHPEERRDKIEFSVKPESFRLATYFFFWTFIAFAVTVTRMMDVPELAAGAGDVPLEMQGCGPFNRDSNGGALPTNTFNLSFGEGFDYHTQNHLTEAFGFGNICTNWDYKWGRTITSYYFPFFEYSMVIYLFINHAIDWIAYYRGYLKKWQIYSFAVITAISMYFAVLFRGIFIFRAFEQTRLHTFGFLTLQICLITLAYTNVVYVISTGQIYPSYSWLNTKEKVSRVAYWYLIPNLIVSAFKIWATIVIVFGLNPEHPGYSPDWYKYPTFVFGMPLGKVLDRIWMVFTAVGPAVISYIRWKEEDPLVITITAPKFDIHHDEGNGPNEHTPLFD